MSQCLVEFDDYDESCKMLSEKIVTARKPHKCAECRKMILPGEKYELYVGIDCNKVFSEHTCLVCAELKNTFCCSGYEFGNIRGMIRDALREHEDVDIGCLDGLSHEAGLIMAGWIDELGETEGSER